MSRVLWSSLVLLLIVNLASSALVESMNYKGVHIESVDENKYTIRIEHSDGSVLKETVQKNLMGEFELTGKLFQEEFSPLGTLFIAHQYGLNGANARYRYVPPSTTDNLDVV